uniref:Kazal-like domain-containing protein n=1 Tax=Magallana gigas TaxID=29159 RepID=A0A8W8K049_MAGGI
MKSVICLVSLFAVACCVDQSTHCNMVCPMSWIPLCGSDGHTYSNECELRVTNCLQKSNIVKVRSGTCDTDTVG